jgi:hypothetical protein
MKTPATKSDINTPDQSQALNRLLLAKEKRREANEGACVKSEESGLLVIGISK